MKTIISVTADDIKRGWKDNCYSCPIALALERVLDKVASRAVYAESVDVYYRATRLKSDVEKIPLPPIAQEFIARFDDGSNLAQPFEFELEINAKYLPVDESAVRPLTFEESARHGL